MRPVRLRIKGINSFNEEQTIDFEKLTKDGLFGIVGDTGSGKSSILDAMTIALYGDLSKDTNEFINKEADTASVVLDFAVEENAREEFYRAERTFKRTGTKECAAGIARLSKGLEGASVLADKTREMNRAIETIIGLSFGDFTRTVVLPQGKFSEFLNLRGAERRAMLERIFNLERYGSALAARLKAERAETGGRLNALSSKIEVYGDISRELCTIKRAELEAVKKELKTASKRLESIRAQAAEAEKINTLQEKITKCLNELRLIEEQKNGIEAFAEGIGIYELTQENMSEAVNAFKQAVRLTAEIKNDHAAKKELLTKLNGIKYSIDKLSKEKAAVITDIELAKKAVEAAQRHREELSRERSRDLDEMIKGGDRLKEAREAVYIAKESFVKQKTLLGEINVLISEIKAENDRLAALNESLEGLEKEKRENNSAIESAENGISLMKDKNMAAILARGLEDGKPCPVCGSAEHPNIAKSVENAVIEACEKELKSLKAKGTDIDKQINKAKAGIGASQSLAGRKNAEKAVKEAEAGSKTLAQLKDIFDRAKAEYKEEERKAEGRKKAQEKEKAYLDAEKKEKEARQRLEGLLEKDRHAEKAIAEGLTQTKIAESELDRLDVAIQAKQKEIIQIAGEREPSALLKEAERAAEVLGDYSRRRNFAEDNLKSLKDELGDRKTDDKALEVLRYELKGAEAAKEEKSNEAAVREKELAGMEESADIVEALKKEKASCQKKFDMLNELARLTEGNKFVEYMAENQLKYIAADASVRLKNISGGRYALELLDGEFIIRDDFCGGIKRRPATLSGGETFLTSFALALSLSDRIQMKNSSSLKFFFLDEGFGTLDKNTLDIVMKSLETLCQSGMSVGLITHVEEVKERLPVKLVVERAVPGERGSMVRIRS